MMRLLVVDDEPLVRDDILFLLQKGGFEADVLQAANGVEALREIARAPVDAVLLDICMPGMGGLELLRRIRAEQVNIPVVIISGWDNFSYAQQAMHDGAMDYLLKPIDVGAFDEAMNRVADRLRANRDSASPQEGLEHDRLKAERLVNQCLLGSPVQPEAVVTLDVRAMAAVLFWAQNGRGQDEAIFAACDVLSRHADRECAAAGVRCHTIPFYGASNELLIIACGTLPDAMPRLGRALLGAIEELSGQGCSVCAAVTHVAGQDAQKLGEAHGRLLDTLRQRFLGSTGLLPPRPFPVDADRQRRTYMRQALSQQGSVAGLSREAARSVLASVFTLSFFDVMAADQAQATFSAMEGAVMDACLPIGGAVTGSRAGDRGLQRFRNLPEVTDYLSSYLLSQQSGNEHPDVANLMRDARSYVYDNYLHPLTLHMLAERFHVNPNYLSCIYKEVNGVNFIDDLTDLRVRHAMRLLVSAPVSISKVAEMSGFSSQAYFQKVFKKHSGKTPNEYRLNNLQSTSVDI